MAEKITQLKPVAAHTGLVAQALGLQPNASPEEIEAAMQAKAESLSTCEKTRECFLCQRETWVGNRCNDCLAAISRASSFRAEHCVIPRRYEGAHDLAGLDMAKSYLLAGPPGAGKTHVAYSIVQRIIDRDPRVTVAAQSWTTVLMA